MHTSIESPTPLYRTPRTKIISKFLQYASKPPGDARLPEMKEFRSGLTMKI